MKDIIANFNYIKSSLNVSILYENGFHTVESSVLSGGNLQNKGYFFAQSISYEEDQINELTEKNIFSHDSYVENLTSELHKINEIAKKQNLYFSSFFEYETQYVKIKKKQKCLDEYRVKKIGNIALTDEKKSVFYKNILIHDNVFETIRELNKSFASLQNEVYIANNYNKLNKKFKSDIIFSPEAGGYFVHEIFGHPLEGDLVSNKISLFSDMKIGSRLCDLNSLNIIDDPHKITGIGLSKFDDEGNSLKDIVLVKNGYLNGYICDQDTSLNITGTDKFSSCSRTSSYNSIPIPRMRTTYIDKNKNGDDLHEIINKTKDAYLIKSIHSGWVHPVTGDFILSCSICSKIKNGMIVEDTYGLNIKGNILETLNNIEHIGNDLVFQISTCVKDNQPIAVGVGSPTLFVKNLLVEG